jgi:hypothetical protein
MVVIMMLRMMRMMMAMKRKQMRSIWLHPVLVTFVVS